MSRTNPNGTKLYIRRNILVFQILSVLQFFLHTNALCSTSSVFYVNRCESHIFHESKDGFVHILNFTLNLKKL
jgi:hypothetical protein